MALGLSIANDIANAVLTFYTRGDALAQTTQDKPLLRLLREKQKTFPGGKDNISDPIQGTYMSDTAGFFAGYSEDDQLAFAQAGSLLRTAFPWKEVHAGLIISFTELKKDGISITDGQKESEHSKVELTRLTGLLKNRIADFMESWSRQMNSMLWQDGSQDAKQTPGVLSILTDTPAVGTTGGLDRATYSFWRHRALIGASKILPSAANQTLTKTLRAELIQLRRFGGKPDVALCGSGFLDALRLEVQEKGYYTQTGWSDKKTDVGMPGLKLDNLNFEYDPTLDSLNLSKRCYVYDSRRLVLRPMEGEEQKVSIPERPYQYMVFLKSVTWTGALTCAQLNANAVYEVN